MRGAAERLKAGCLVLAVGACATSAQDAADASVQSSYLGRNGQGVSVVRYDDGRYAAAIGASDLEPLVSVCAAEADVLCLQSLFVVVALPRHRAEAEWRALDTDFGLKRADRGAAQHTVWFRGDVSGEFDFSCRQGVTAIRLESVPAELEGWKAGSPYRLRGAHGLFKGESALCDRAESEP